MTAAILGMGIAWAITVALFWIWLAGVIREGGRR